MLAREIQDFIFHIVCLKGISCGFAPLQLYANTNYDHQKILVYISIKYFHLFVLYLLTQDQYCLLKVERLGNFFNYIWIFTLISIKSIPVAQDIAFCLYNTSQSIVYYFVSFEIYDHHYRTFYNYLFIFNIIKRFI